MKIKGNWITLYPDEHQQNEIETKHININQIVNITTFDKCATIYMANGMLITIDKELGEKILEYVENPAPHMISLTSDGITIEEKESED